MAAMKIFDKLENDAIALAIGGGPQRHHPKLMNINIGYFPNVDIVADAHFLPYADNCIDAIYCEAVIEHLYDPAKAVKEMFRVLKKGGAVYSCTPFLQGYHGYPHHYQNYTLTGHRKLFESNGFHIKEAGTCVGPTYALLCLNFQYLKEFLPCFLKSVAYLYVVVGQLFLKYVDKIINPQERSHVLASTTYLLAEKK